MVQINVCKHGRDDTALRGAFGRVMQETAPLALSEERQKLMTDNLADYARGGNRKDAAQMTADIFSPLNRTPSAAVQTRLNEQGVVNGVLPGPVVNARNIHFADPVLEDRRLRIQNDLQMRAAAYPNYMLGSGLDIVRTSQYLLGAAARAEARGDLALARELVRKAQGAADQSGLSPGESRAALGDAISRYVGPNQPLPQMRSTNPDFLRIARPVAGAFEQINRVGQLSDLDRAAIRIGGEFIDAADVASSQGS